MSLKRIFLLTVFLLLWAQSPLHAQVDFHQLASQTRIALKDFTCPPGGSMQACATFQKMVAAGSQEVSAQFMPLFLDSKYFGYLVYVVFDSGSDQFWIISTAAAHGDKGLVLTYATYGHYQDGQMVTGVVAPEDIPVSSDNETNYTSKKDGVKVSYFSKGDVSVTSAESWQASDGSARTVTLSVSKSPNGADTLVDETITLESPTQKLVHSGKALRFSSQWTSADNRR